MVKKIIYTKIKFSQVKYASFAHILKDNLHFCTNSYNLKYIISAINKEEELKTIFVSSCIESAARALNCRTSEMHLRMKRINLIENYIWGFYDVLHTQSKNSTLKKERKDKLMLNVYHGSTVRVTAPIAKAGREHLDFRQGFYINDIKEQAERWLST